MNWKQECVQKRNCKIIPLKDSKCKSQFRIDNSGGVEMEIVCIDGCQITSGRRCDYLVHIPSIKKALFVELKGTDLEHGIHQVEETLNKYKNRFREYVAVCYVICSQFPRAATNKQIFQKRFKKKFSGTTLRIERTPYTERI